MALVRISQPAAKVSGNLNGINFAYSIKGPYIRIRRRPNKPPTPKQAKYRALWYRFNSYWHNMTQALRDDWDDFAANPNTGRPNRLGHVRPYSGYQWFIRCNIRRFTAGRVVTLTPPGPEYPTSIIDPSVTPTFYSASTCNIDWQDNQFSASEAIIVKAAFSRSLTSTRIHTKLVLVYAATYPPNGPYDIYNAVIESFGMPRLGVTINVTFQRQSNRGKHTPVQLIQETVT